MKRSVKIVSLITIVFTFIFGIISLIPPQNISGLIFTVYILGIGIGILSKLDEMRSKSFFNASLIIILTGSGIIGVYQGYTHPAQIGQWNMVTNLESFYAVFVGYFFHNTSASFVSLLGGPTIIIPYGTLSSNIAHFFGFTAGIITYYGPKGLILILGWLHAYPELTAIFMAIMAGIRIALESFQAFIHMKYGFLNSMRKIRDAMVFEIVNTMPKVMALLLIAAVLETLWIPFWVNYWLHHIL